MTKKKRISAATRAVAAAGSRERLPEAVVREVWARAGGICSFPSCPEVLYLDPIRRKRVQFGQVAHNVAAMPGGERGHPKRSRELCKDPDNLILLCPTHHTLVDKPGAATDYPDSLLAEWKALHEAAIRHAGTLATGTLAHALILQAPIGGQPRAINPRTIPFAMLQAQLVMQGDPALVNVDAATYAPKSAEYWRHVISAVRHEMHLRQSNWAQTKRPIALFALADMPTLMALGLALGHAAQVSVFQFDPTPNGGSGDWRFPRSKARAHKYHIRWPEQMSGPIALAFSLSGVLERDRIEAALPGCSIVEITADEPTTDLIRTPADIDAFARTLRACVAGLEKRLSKTTPIHVFPAMPASLAVTFGRFVKPKVSFPFRIYDAEGPSAPFAFAVQLPFID